jgi:hypothetical protein
MYLNRNKGVECNPPLGLSVGFQDTKIIFRRCKIIY